MRSRERREEALFEQDFGTGGETRLGLKGLMGSQLSKPVPQWCHYYWRALLVQNVAVRGEDG
jgi:hypothetical protein